MSNTFRSVKGTNDLYPPQSLYFEYINNKAKQIFRVFDYQPLILPHMEYKKLFIRGVGKVTDIVQKQMFVIKGKDIVLRPEGTAQVARFYIEKHLDKKKNFYKFYYIGSMFRGERPQRGRLREFHHIGAEAIGSDNPYLDAEIINIALKIVESIGLKDFILKINSLGCKQDKEKLASIIKKQLTKQKNNLCSDCQRRIEYNPLRVLDCKNKDCRKLITNLSIRNKHLCKNCIEHFQKVKEALKDLSIIYEHDSLLVRGLDYYTHTVFEIISSRLGAQDALGAGGRYNYLINELGGPNVPAIGFALGLERLMLIMEKIKNIEVKPKIFAAYTSSKTFREAYRIIHSLRENGISADIDYNNKSLKSQLKYAQKYKIPFVFIVGDDELARGRLIIRNMEKSAQEEVSLNSFMEIIKEKLYV